MADLQRILHVEDDLDIQEIARLALVVVGGLHVDQFDVGSMAVASAVSCAPDLILLDQMMPEMSGEETLAALRKLPEMQDKPAVFMTAQTNDSSARLLQETDAVAVIPKPFDPMTLAQQLRDIWVQHA